MKIGKNEAIQRRFRYLCNLHYTTGRCTGISIVSSTLLIMVCLSCTPMDDHSIPELVDQGLSLDTQWIATDLEVPWQMANAGDGNIFFTEKKGHIKKLDLTSGLVQDLYRFDSLATEIQTGLLGLCLHPEFPENPLLYVAKTYYSGSEILMHIMQLTWASNQLIEPKILIDSLPSFVISTGGRLAIGMDQKLYVTVGEGKHTEKVQDPNACSGKILRFNLDGSIPSDNPFPNNPVFAMGFRNPQGIVQTPYGIYASEHGNFSNDEVNLLKSGANYGWPIWGGRCLSLQDSCQKFGFQEPLFDWSPCIAPSGIAFYQGDQFPAWHHCLLLACLKEQQLKVAKLNETGTQIIAEKDYLKGIAGRLRDVLVLPGGRILVATSNEDVYGTPRHRGDKIIEISPGLGKWEANQTKSRKLQPYIKLDSTTLQIRVVAKNLRIPWQMTYDPEGWIWFNERGGTIKKVHPETKIVKEVIQIEGVYESKDNSGMHGFTLHPSFPSPPFIYLHYCTKPKESILLRLEMDQKLSEIIEQDTLMVLPAGYTHNGSRLLFGPDSMLYFCTGDALKKRSAQNLDKYTGKVLRLKPDGTVPSDNPFPNSHIWSYGHRNPQGLAFSENRFLFASEHGESTDDEINLILRGKNYGYPKVFGFCDQPSEKLYCQKNSIVEPLFTFTPTVALAGMAYYNHTSIPEWENSLLVTALKAGNGDIGQRLYQCKLNHEMNRIEKVEDYFSYSFGRLRDVLVTPDGRVYLCTSNQEPNGNGDQVVTQGDDLIVELKAAN